MTDRPILFSGPMIGALLDGRKTQTRRTLKDQPPEWATYCQQPTMLNALQQWVPSGLWAWSEEEQNPPRQLRRWPVNADGEHYWLRPRFSIGDRLWVREAFRGSKGYDRHPPRTWSNWPVHYEADGAPDPRDELEMNGRLRPGIHMPRWASRLTLAVTDVRVERLQSISQADAIAEGCPAREGEDGLDPCGWYAQLWDEINGAGAWATNPWVAAYTFRVIGQNIDEVGK